MSTEFKSRIQFAKGLAVTLLVIAMIGICLPASVPLVLMQYVCLFSAIALIVYSSLLENRALRRYEQQLEERFQQFCQQLDRAEAEIDWSAAERLLAWRHDDRQLRPICRYYVGSNHLRCTVNPCAQHCRDCADYTPFESKA